MSASAQYPQHGLLEAVAERLIPLFLTAGQTVEYARAAALGAIASYAPQTPADYASIARVLAFTLAAIAAIGRSAEPDLPPNLQLRFLGKANTLSRSAEQAERGMTQRRRQGQQPKPERPMERPVERPGAVPPPPEPSPSEDMVIAQVESAMAEFRALLPEAPAVHAARPPFAIPQAAAALPSFRQTLRQQRVSAPSTPRADEPAARRTARTGQETNALHSRLPGPI